MTYSTVTDVSRELSGYVFTSTTSPSTTDVTAIIKQQDSWIDRVSGHTWTLGVALDEQHDGVPVDGRLGIIIPNNEPIIQILKVEFWINGWNTAVEAIPGDPVIQGPHIYNVYYDKNVIYFEVLRLAGTKRYRLSYLYGYASTPLYISELSAKLAAREVMRQWGGRIMTAENVVKYREDLTAQIDRILNEETIRSAGTVLVG